MQEKTLPWCSVTVHGFADAPVTQKMREHGFHNNGDNLCTYLIFPEGTWVFSALGDRDVYTWTVSIRAYLIGAGKFQFSNKLL